MKILKIFGIVVGIHVFALILIFANPGCSSTKKSPPSTVETGSKPEASPAPASAPSTPSSVYSSTTDSSLSPPPVGFNPNAPAGASPASSSAGRSTPTRPGTPVAGVLQNEPVTNVTPAATYTVKSGDNLSTIARKNNTTIAQLTQANNLTTKSSLRPGQKLIIPGKSESPSAAATMNSSPVSITKTADSRPAAAVIHTGNEVVKHTVKSGETLGGIARKYEVRQGDIAVANNIADPAKIRPGMELIIPGWQSPGSKSGKSAPKSTSGSSKSASPASLPVEPVPSAQLDPAPTTAPSVPVIKIDEPPASAPKQP